jgi:hypothetical protein
VRRIRWSAKLLKLMTAWAWVQRHDKGETSGIGEGGGVAGEGDEPILQGLAEGFEGIAAELGQLVEEEDAVVGEADPPGVGHYRRR